MSPPTYDSLLASLGELQHHVDRAARLKRRYEWTIGFLAATCFNLIIYIAASR